MADPKSGLQKNSIYGDFRIHHAYTNRLLGVDLHCHDFYEVLFFLSSKVKFVIENKIYSLHPGDVVLINIGDFYRFYMPEGNHCERYFLWLTSDYLKGLNRGGTDLMACFIDTKIKPYKVIRAEETDVIRIKQYFERIFECHKKKVFGSEILQHAYIIELIVFLNQLYFNEPHNSEVYLDVVENEKVSRAIEYINRHIGENISVDSISKIAFLSKHYFNHLFKKYTGISVYQYVLKKRLNNAKRLIMHGIPAVEACYTSGFSDYSNFSKAFKREFRQLPRDFMINKRIHPPQDNEY